ncbi:MAG TPA: DUF4412 domain-containing protein [Thermoanaerobaculia bacterium]|nr:DUF4412 domain-containing protein [Thermoanaerobaculia bacterium]
MKRLSAALLTLLAASPLAAGLTYRFQTSTSGIQSSTLTGKVTVAAPNMRVEVLHGDGILFQDGQVVLSKDGSQTLTVIDPASKSYYDLSLEQTFGGANSLLTQLGGSVMITFENPKADVKNLGDGGTIEGYPTRRYAVTFSFDLVFDAMGQKMRSRVTTSSMNWMTERIGADAMSFLQLQGFRTGIDAVDKLMALQATKINGFPLKQVTTVTVSQPGGRDVTSTSTTSVTGIQNASVNAQELAIPAGYKKVESPMDKMLRRISAAAEP